MEIRDAAGHRIERLRVFALPGEAGLARWGAIGGLGWEAEPGPGEIRAVGSVSGRPFAISVPFAVLPRAFATEDIALDKANTELRAVPDPKKTAEALSIQAIYARIDTEARWGQAPFLSPVGDARRSAGFGDRRRYLYATGGSDSSWHSGIDFAVPVGTPVRAPAAGRVVFSDSRIVTGYTMVIEHQPGLYSVLMHLSKGVAPVGSLVKAGDLVAYSGVSGLATGPHLHWEVRAGEVPVDPDYFLSAGAGNPFPWLDTPASSGQ